MKPNYPHVSDIVLVLFLSVIFILIHCFLSHAGSLKHAGSEQVAKTVEVTEPLQRFSPGAAIPWHGRLRLYNP